MGTIKIIDGNIFNSKAQTIVNTVNCVGVMGKGIALVFKLRYPKLFEKYQELCRQRLIEVGKLWLYREEPDAPWVLSFPTKKHWKDPSEYSYIEAGLKKFVDTFKEKGITSIAFPLLGANNGGLDAARVLDIMQSYLSQCDIDIEIYRYDPTAKDDLFDTFKERWNALGDETKRIELGLRTRKRVMTINEAVNDENVKSLITLASYKGIGIESLSKCFALAMKKEVEPTLDLK
jgi:O-acetyl-ADP-ribose deacetylase (regulator of RNase III)